MKSRGTYVLLVLFFAGLASLWWADFARVPTRRQRERMSTRILPELLDARPDDLKKIEILGGPESLVFVRKEDGSGWRMTSPINVEADPSKVETLAYNLKELSRRPEAATLEGDPARFGLDKPERVVRLWGAKTSEPLASLDIGLENEKLGRRYVRPTGAEGVEVVDARSLALLRLDAINWRDRELFRVPSFEIDAVDLKSATGELKLKRGADAWRLEIPFRTLAAEAKVEGLIADLGSLRVLGDDRFVANDVKPADLERFGLKHPTLTIEVGAGRGLRVRPPQVLHVGKPVEGSDGLVYVVRGDEDDVLIVDSRILKDLKVDPNQYRSPKVADIKPARVTKIALESPNGGFEMVRNRNDWSIISPSESRADRKAVDDFLKSLDKLETNIYPLPGTIGDSGLDKSPIVLKVWQVVDPREAPTTASGPGSTKSSEAPALSLRIGRRDAARRSIYAQIEGDSTILALPDTANDFLPRSVLAFRDRQILNEAIEPIQRISLAYGTRKFVINAPPFKIDPFRKAPMGWWMVEPVDAPADAGTIGVFLRVIAGLRCDSLVAESTPDLEAFGLKSPALTLSWSSLPRFSMVDAPLVLPPGSTSLTLKERSLLVGNQVPGKLGTRYAKISDRPLIFTVGPEILTILNGELRDHHVLTFNPDHVQKIRLEWPGRGFDLEPTRDSENTTWAIQGPVVAPDFDQKELASLIKVASNLTTTKYTQHLGDFPPYAVLNPPRLAIRFDLDDGTIPRNLRVGASDGRGQLFATTETGTAGPIFLLPEGLLKAWLMPPSLDLPENVFAP